MAVGLKGGTTLAGTEDKTFYVRAMLARATPHLWYNRFANQQGIPTRNGTNLEWRRLSRITATTTALTEGTSGAETTPTVVTVVATVNQYGQYFRSTEVVLDQAIDDIKAESAEALGQAMGESLDLLSRAIFLGGTQIQYASTATTRLTVGSGMRMSSAEVREAVATLENQDAEPFEDGAYKAIIHPHTKADLFADTNFLNAQQNAGPRGGDNALFTGAIGRYLNVDFHVTSNAQVGTSLGLSGADVYYSVFCGKDAVGVSKLNALAATIIYQEPGSGGATGDPLAQVWSEGWKASHGGNRLNESWLVRVEHTSSLSSFIG